MLPCKAEPLWKHGNEDPCVEAVEEHLKDAVDGDKSGSVVRVAICQLIPHQDHCDAASDADQDESAHIGRFAAKEYYGENEHERRPNEPVLDQGESENPLVAEDIAQFLVSDLCQRRKHHDDQPDGNWDIRCSALKALDEPRRAWNEVANGDSNGHCEENPEREEAVEEREILPLQWRAIWTCVYDVLDIVIRPQ